MNGSLLPATVDMGGRPRHHEATRVDRCCMCCVAPPRGRYQPIIHAGVVRQAAEMRAIVGGESLRTGARAEVTFHFM
jgi:hypothetical protein